MYHLLKTSFRELIIICNYTLAVSIRLLLSFLRSASLMNVGSVCSVHHRMISFLLSTSILWALRKVLNKRTSKWMNEIFWYTCLSSYDIPDIRVVLTVYGLGLLEWFFFKMKPFLELNIIFSLLKTTLFEQTLLGWLVWSLSMVILLYTIHLLSYLASLEFTLSF